MPNNPFINQMNIQGTLYDLNDSRITKDQYGNMTIESEGGITLTSGDGQGGHEVHLVLQGAYGTVGVAIDNQEEETLATEPWVLEQLSDIAIQGGMVFKGAINSNSEVPATHEAGWVYLIQTAGTYAGITCEAGDLLVCKTSGTTANNAHWTVVQNNIDIDGLMRLVTGMQSIDSETDISRPGKKGDVYRVSEGQYFFDTQFPEGGFIVAAKDYEAYEEQDEQSLDESFIRVPFVFDKLVYKGQIDGADDITHFGYKGDVYYINRNGGYWLNQVPTPLGGGLAIALSDYDAYDAQDDSFSRNGAEGRFAVLSFGGNAFTFAGQDAQVAVYSGTDGIVGKTLSATAGISVAQTSSAITFSHANSITAGAFGPSASASALSFALPYVQYDAQGHISSVASFAHTIPTFAPATSSSAGQAGVLPAMSSMTSEQETWVLYANGTWGPQLGSGDEGYTLPLAADGTRGGLQVGYATDRTSGYFAVQLQSEKAYVAIPTFTGATSQADGAQGLVPQSFASASTAFLRADGEWANVAYVSSNILYM